MRTKSCSVPCRYANRVGDGWHCRYRNITHGVDQYNCHDYVGEMTVMEYLFLTQPQTFYDMLSKFNLKIVDARNQYGFNIVRNE